MEKSQIVTSETLFSNKLNEVRAELVGEVVSSGKQKFGLIIDLMESRCLKQS
jgi:hypothetical protein